MRHLAGARGPAALLLLLLASACRTLPAPGALYVVPDERERMRQWVERARAEGEERQRIRAEGKLKLESPAGSGSVRQVIVAERPAQLRLETLNLLGQTQTLLVTDGERFAFFDGRSLERGEITSDVLRDRLGLDLGPPEAVAALLAAPGVRYDPSRPVLGQGDERIVDTGSHRLRFGPNGDLLGMAALDAGGTVRWIARYDRWRESGGGRYPYGVTLFFPATDLRAELQLREVELNPPLDPALFRVSAERGE